MSALQFLAVIAGAFAFAALVHALIGRRALRPAKPEFPLPRFAPTTGEPST